MMASSRRALGLRAQILLMLAGAIFPLALLGLWLSASAKRAGERLLQTHLEESADRFAAAVNTRWEYRVSDILLLAGNEATARVVRGTNVTREDSAFLASLANELGTTIPVIALRDVNGRALWSSNATTRVAQARASSAGRGATPLPTLVSSERPILDERGARIGTAVTSIAMSALIPPDSARPLVPGARVGVRNLDASTIAIPLTSFTPVVTDSGPATIDGAPWRLAIRRLGEPPLEIAIGAPTAPYVAPFERNARVGTVALIVLALVTTTIVLAWATRATRALQRLATASGAIADGKLQQQVEIGGPAEVRHVGAAFNSMSARLRSTLDELSRRSALAAVGEFATSLSHDVRNALTSIKVDLERAEMRGDFEPDGNRLVARALANVARLESVVSGALRVARGSGLPMRHIDLRCPLEEAIDSAQGAFAAVPASLVAEIPAVPVAVHGDASALQQLFANLLFNAAQALRPGGSALVRVLCEDGVAETLIRDDGHGITSGSLEKLVEGASPFFSTKPAGTGLGIPIARQIAAAHGGTIAIESVAGRETVVRVRLPLLNDTFPAVERSAPAGTVAAASSI
jgi:signal transduction histidine kinase